MSGQIAGVIGALEAHEAGHMLNFVEQPFDTAGVFPEDVEDRLRKVKAAYDPDGVMHANHAVAAA